MLLNLNHALDGLGGPDGFRISISGEEGS